MAIVKEFRLPDLGEGLTGAEIVRWLVGIGDVIAVDQPVVEVETAKAVVEVPCPYAGVVTARFAEPGDEIPVGQPLVTVAVGEPERRDEGGGTPPDGSGNVLVGYGTSGPAPRRRRLRAGAEARPGLGDRGAGPTQPDETAPAASAAPAAPATSDVREEAVGGPVPVVSPLVRRLAREHGVDLRALRGSGPEGLVLRSDVERAIAAPPLPATEPAEPTGALPAAAAAGDSVRIPLRGVRGAMAEKLSRSRREIPDATCWVDADATELLAARAAMNAAGMDQPVSLLALLARICTAALARCPELNATVDTERNEIVRLPAVHLGFAAQGERGLVVPVVRDAHTRTTEDLSAEITRLTEAARAGRLAPAELTGGTFTLNNYGVFGVDGSTPIINHPEAAMLGIGRITPKPWVCQGELAVRQVVQLSLTFDHRICDGATAGGFLRFVADCVEHPSRLLRGV